MKKWIVIVAILICCGLYAIVKFSMSQNQNVSNQSEETPNTKQINAGDADKVTPEEDSEPAVSADKVEAITKVYSEFTNALKNEDYEQAWKFTSEYFKGRVSDGSLEKFKENMATDGAVLAKATIHPESAISIEERIGLLYTCPDFPYDMYLFFTQEDGQWKLYIGRRADSVDTSTE